MKIALVLLVLAAALHAGSCTRTLQAANGRLYWKKVSSSSPPTRRTALGFGLLACPISRGQAYVAAQKWGVCSSGGIPTD